MIEPRTITCPNCLTDLVEVLEERRDGARKTYHHATGGRCCRCRSSLQIDGRDVTATPPPENQVLGTLGGSSLPFFRSAQAPAGRLVAAHVM